MEKTGIDNMKNATAENTEFNKAKEQQKQMPPSSITIKQNKDTVASNEATPQGPYESRTNENEQARLLDSMAQKREDLATITDLSNIQKESIEQTNDVSDVVKLVREEK